MIRFELYLLRCAKCGARNAPTKKHCAKCGSMVFQWRQCSTCLTENPPDAFICVSCSRFLKEKPPVSVIHWRVPLALSLVVIMAAAVWFLHRGMKGWLEATEAQIQETMVTDHLTAFQKQELQSRQSDVP